MGAGQGAGGWEGWHPVLSMDHTPPGFLQAREGSLHQGSHQTQAARKLGVLRNQPELPESEFRAGLALRCPPSTDSGPGRSMKLQPLEPVALSWIVTAGQPGMLETPLLLTALPLPKLFCHQISEEQHAAGFQTAAAAPATCEPPS